MKLKKLSYYFRETFSNLSRHSWLTLATTATIAVSLLVLGIFLLLAVNANNLARYLESEVEIVAFLKVDTPPEEVKAVGEKIKGLSGVASVELVTKEEGLNQLAKQFGEKHDLLGALGGKNPLPDYYRVRAVAAADVPLLAAKIQEIGSVEEVNYGQHILGRLLKLTAWIRLVGGILVALLGAAAVFLIILTVRLTVTARKKEIAIMKYIGATDWFIRWPFFLEGLLLGVLGALIAGAVLYFGYASLVSRVQASLFFLPLVSEPTLLLNLFLLLVTVGASVGAAGSLISLHRFLEV